MIPELELNYGVFEKIEDAIDAAFVAQKDYEKNYTLEDRKRFIDAIRVKVLEEVEYISNMEYEETGYGRPEDKLMKNIATINDVPGVEYLPSGHFCGDQGVTMEFYSPFGVIGALTPVTNPSATIAGNGVSNLAAGNGVVFNAHPAAKVSTAYAIQLFNKTIVAEGGPNNLLTCVANPSMDSLNAITSDPRISLMIGTGGPAMVATLMKSGKKCICAGPGNPPTVIDETVDLDDCAVKLIQSHSMENNTMCIAEKEAFVLDEVFDEFMAAMERAGAKVLTAEEAEKVTAVSLVKDENGEYHANKEYVGKNTNVILKAAGVECEGDPRTAIFEAENMHPLVQTEQMQPILPIVRCKDFETALEWAVAAEHGNRHSASIWSENVLRATEMGKAIKTTIFAQCGPTLSAFGTGGEGTSAPTIATPTGEGPTGPWTFLRKRRFAMAGGRNYIA